MGTIAPCTGAKRRSGPLRCIILMQPSSPAGGGCDLLICWNIMVETRRLCRKRALGRAAPGLQARIIDGGGRQAGGLRGLPQPAGSTAGMVGQ